MYSVQSSYRGAPPGHPPQGHPPPGPPHPAYGYGTQSGPPPPPQHYSVRGQPPPTINGSTFDISRGSTRTAPSVAHTSSGTVTGPNSGFDRDRDGYRDGAWGYRGRFLGSKSMGTAEPQPETVGQVVDSLIEYYKTSEVQPRRYLIRIRSQILELEELENDEVHIQNVPLDAITFCASDNRYPRIFTFVARAESGYMCHIFYCRHVADVDRLTKDFDDAFRNSFAEWQKGGTVTQQALTQSGVADPAVAQAVEAALQGTRPPSRYRANVKEVLVEEQPRSLPLYNFQGQRVKSMRSRPTNGAEPSSTRYIFAYEDGEDDDESTVQVLRKERKSHRYPVAKEQFRYSGSSEKSKRREYRREYVVQGQQYAAEQQQGVRREYVLAQPAPSSVPVSAHAPVQRTAVPASYRTEFVTEHPASVVHEADGRSYNQFYEAAPAPRPVTVVQTHAVPSADGPASVIVDDRDMYGARGDYGSVHLTPPVAHGQPIAYAVHAASNDRSDMLY